MALQLTKIKIEAVMFGDFAAMPQMTEEKRLRVRELKLDPHNRDKVTDVLSSCFPDDKERVQDFITKEMGLLDCAKLQAYLLGGDQAVADLEGRMKAMEDKHIDRIVDKLVAKMETENE